MTKLPKLRPALLLAATLALAACGNERLFTAPVFPEAGLERVPSQFRTLEVQDVSLPDYAASGQIPARQADGSVKSSRSVLWADEPTRAVTLELARLLRQITATEVAAEPWPYFDSAQAQLQVRVESMLAEGDGSFRLTGQYFVAPTDGRRGRSDDFMIAVPVSAPGGPSEIADARSQAVLALARQIARGGLR
ncbi:membrane integrity-associated transporter subunit PqiC [Pseudooceanicola sp. HF7]|uniref:PqiC family protein n=1 Tax=Pseudooceanicola sp. HF7 TaxID=2721560 RepID=UPI0014317D64|nr:ABC-type transport auxiliary lipoprotein family protein [Pseudooceanicola sp. HF7]NIZ10107.1 membrane integrity-associated transporter subunit PqiC [Pseudooceanicola sp. HF7]